MKLLLLLFIALLAAINIVDAVGPRKNFAFAVVFQRFNPFKSSLKKMFNWNSAVNFMKMKWGALVVDGRGKIGGHVASKNRAGAYLRTKVTPVNPQSSDQLTVRNRFTTYSQLWRGLTQAQRDAWNAAVADFARTDIFGDLKNPTGFNLYQRLNNNLVLASETAITSPPTPEAVGIVVASSLTAISGTPSLSLVLTGNVPLLTGAKIFATPAMSPGKSFVKSEYRLIDVLAAEATTPVDLYAAYLAKFGAITEADSKIFVKVEPINRTTGQVGTPSQVSDIIEAA